jgi:hypothetical protein
VLDLLLSPRRRLLDGRPDVAVAYSARRVRTAHRGPLMRVRRSSDMLEADFGAGQPIVDWPALSGFIGGGTGSVSKWYDQSGNARDLVQPAATSQPQVMQLSNGLPGLVFDGSDDVLALVFTLTQPWTFQLCYRHLSFGQTSYENMIDGIAPDSSTVFAHTNSYDVGTYAGDFGPFAAPGTTVPNLTRAVIGGTFNGAASLLEVNGLGLSSHTGNPLGGNPGGVTIGCRGDQHVARFAHFELQEFIAFSTAHASAQVKADNAAMRRDWSF